MDRRRFKSIGKPLRGSSLKQNQTNKGDGSGADFGGDSGTDGRLAALRELGSQLQLKAERMRLLARAEEGLNDVDSNPYSPGSRTSYKDYSEMEKSLVVAPDDVPSQIPVSTARQRRRTKQIKTRSGPHSKVDIKHYKPGYVWNRGGRMKELRIRCLARKFLHLWIKGVYGRVRPSQARHHHYHHVLAVTFGAWYEIWWEARKEWRLMVRAECHFRYVLWRKTFSVWRDFIIKKRVRNTKVALAEQHGSCKLLRRCLKAWIGYTDLRRHKKQKRQIAVHHFHHVTVRFVWGTWIYQYQLIQERRQMEVVALQFWAHRIQKQHWQMWRARIANKKSEIMNHYRAVRYHNTALVRGCLQAWIQYWARRRQRLREKEYGMTVYQRTLMSRVFRHWKDGYQLRIALAEHEEKIHTLSLRFQIRRAFVRWQKYIDLIMKEREKMEMADAHYKQKLKVAGLSAFKLCVSHKQLKTMRQEQADHLRHKQMVLRVWNRWLAGCENNEELRILSLTRKARKHYQHILCRKAFTRLQDYCAWRQHRQSQYARADAHYYMRVIPVCLFHMKVFVQLMKIQRENIQKAVEFRTENLLARFYFLWCNQFEISQDYRMNERMAILHYDDNMTKRFFSTWKLKTQQTLDEAEKEELADEHYRTLLSRSHFRAWKSYIEEVKQGHRNEIRASRHYCERKLKKCLVAWRQFTLIRRRKKEKSRQAYSHYRRIVCRKMVAMWLHYVDTQRAIKQRVELKHHNKCEQLLGDMFQHWRKTVAMQKKERDAEQLATVHYSRCLLQKVVKAWQRYAAIHAYKKSETRQWVETARGQLQEGKLRRYFTRWGEVHRESVLDRERCGQADLHRGQCVLTKVIHAWRLCTQDSIRKSLLRKQGDWFHTVRLTAKFYVRWKHAHSEAIEIKEKTHMALWHWCLNLQRKVLVGWCVYAQERKHKKQRVNEALERRRTRLLKDGITQWLTVANDMSNMRARFAAQQQAKSAYQTYQLVQHCALHWRQWTVSRRQKRGGKPPSPRTTPRLANMQQSSPPSGQYVSHTPRSKSGVSELPAPVLTHSPARGSMSVGGPKVSANIEINVRPQARARPRRPDFLVESLKRAGLYSSIPTEQQTKYCMVSEPNKDTILPNVQIAQTSVLRDQPAEIEKLDLSNLSAEKSEPDHIHTEEQRKPVDFAVDTGVGKTAFAPDKHFGQKRVHALPPQQVVSAMKPYNEHSRLLTPADFMCKRDGNPLIVPEPAPQGFIEYNDLGQNPREALFSGLVSETQSVASTPRILCQNGSHAHPLSATYTVDDAGFQTVPWSRGVTPRDSVSQEVTPRGTVLREVNLTDNVPKTTVQEEMLTKNCLQKEIVHIRNRLRSFDQKKKKLRTMDKQLKQLRDWLASLEVTGQSSEDEDIAIARLEEQELQGDIEALRCMVEAEEEKCAGLVERVKYLVMQIKT